MTDQKYSPADKFNQPDSAITVVSYAPGPRSTLTYFQIEEARRRVAAGENAREVAEEYVRANGTSSMASWNARTRSRFYTST